MEVKGGYDIEKIQEALKKRPGKIITKKQLIGALEGDLLSIATGKKMSLSEIIEKLPPYLRDLETRTEAYDPWKPRFIKQSRTHMEAIKEWLIGHNREPEWDDWYKELIQQIDSYQKFEWNVPERPLKIRSDNRRYRLSRQFGGKLIQFRSSGIRISRGNRHPALVAIGQVPVVGHYLKRPPWQALTKLQSIPEGFVKENENLFGSNGEAIKRLGNAVNVRLVEIMATVLKNQLK
jgi:site-specific DNA-cytosine methylase